MRKNRFYSFIKGVLELRRVTSSSVRNYSHRVSYSGYTVMENDSHLHKKSWDPMKVFIPSTTDKYAVIILNQPILFSPEILLPIWKGAKIKMTVDGGTDRWIDYLNQIADDGYVEQCSDVKPTMIVGDLDSISPEHLRGMMKLEVPILRTVDQNFTDYSKALMQLAVECKLRDVSLDSVYTFVETGGRFDHIMGIINTLYKSHKLIPETETIINVASNSLTWLLNPGKHTIKIPEILRTNKSWVGLIPFRSKPNVVSTTGLKWNLNNTSLEFGGMVSTSNTYDGSPEVTVVTDTGIIWTMGIEPIVTSNKYS